jgi:hypothetical protein
METNLGRAASGCSVREVPDMTKIGIVLGRIGGRRIMMLLKIMR